MIEDVYNSVQKFHSEFRDKFKQVAEDTFDELLKLSGVDVEENNKIVNKIRFSEQIIEGLRSRLSKLSFWQVILWLVNIGCIVAGIYYYGQTLYHYIPIFFIVVVLSLFILFGVISPKKKTAKQELEEECSSVEKNNE